MKRRLGQRKVGVVLFCAIAVVAFTGLTGVAFASDEATLTVSGSDLAIGNVLVGDFSAVKLDGSGGAGAKSTDATFGLFNVTDPTGTGAGWKVTMSASQFTEVEPSGTAHTLPVGIMYLQDMADPTWVFGSKTLPTIAATLDGDGEQVAVDEGTVQVASAAASETTAAFDGAGMGKYEFKAGEFELSVPAGSFAATYTSTLTVSLTSGP